LRQRVEARPSQGAGLRVLVASTSCCPPSLTLLLDIRLLKRATLLFHTLRYSKPSQIYLRLWGWLKAHMGLVRVPLPPVCLRGQLNPAVSFIHHDAWNRRERIQQGYFRFLNHTENLGSPVDWQAAHLPLLWRFNLHYFNYLYRLEGEEQLALCRDWVKNNPPKNGVGWLPFPTSLRIVNWCKANFTDAELISSLYTQAGYLYRNYEAHHPGNHLLENAKAMIFAGSFFAGQGEAQAWLEKGLAIYRRETPVQILSDGGHFERSPMYHALALEAYLDILNLLPVGHSDRNWLIDAAKRMSDYLASITKPDGELALFNDSTQEIATPAGELLSYVKALLGYDAKKRSAFDESGYFIHESQKVYLIIDGGQVAPDFLPAHAHADIFSFELSIKGIPFVVDAGVFEYQAGDLRRFVRSTRAHNTVCVDGQDQAECWGSFRVARRFAPTGVSYKKVNGQSRFTGRFDGYAKLIGDSITHQRQITCNDDRCEIIVEDLIEGEGKHFVESLIHLHPDVELKLEKNCAQLKHSDINCRIESDNLPFTVEDFLYCPQFGLKQQNSALRIGGSLNLPVRLVYSIHY
jgi:uncharacterized heparinase superfamily protein